MKKLPDYRTNPMTETLTHTERLHRAPSHAPPVSVETVVKGEFENTYSAFGGYDRASFLMVAFHTANHRILGLPYAAFREIDATLDADPQRIMLTYSEYTIQIAGRNLHKFLRAFNLQQVEYVKIYNPKQSPRPATDETVVTELSIAPID